MPNAVILKGVEMIKFYVIFICISYVCRERECELCVHGSNGYPRSVFLSGNKKKISQGEGALAGKLCTDARTKDYNNYPKQCVRHFEIDTPFHYVQSKSNPFQFVN